MKGQCQKGAGVDCIRFIAGVLNELYGEERVKTTRLPPDTHLHNRKLAFKAMLEMRRQFRATPVRDGVLQPADIIVVGPPGGGPGHAMIVGHRENELWHSTGLRGVQRTGIAEIARMRFQIIRIYRVKDKGVWIHA